jgi:dTDP-glucose pyrophosphorylase
MWGIIPAAGNGSRIQPLGFSKELLPIGGTGSGETHTLQPAINHIIERLIVGGATRLCVIVSPEKADIMKYIAARRLPVDTCDVSSQATRTV